ncbi:16S rRNA (cytosine(1402)-N(4))-methyltransferase [Bacillus altitudinis]|uniref:tRNA (mnm(5)s(2)U34)-methyltransferase n=1 Tax=Bacillus TaxID=1386 RepID=UPI00061A3F41|nr:MULTISPECIES: class I SAM-dependent methyltransferase [Bacillus]MCA1016759.1 16S rRNA (cytosine(1402)-N(4))-methyltransferase [Bacillus stratosphericus]MDH8711476.1 16S rRNA C1402 N4-methylase RsmH [Micromonospora sp. 1209]CVM42206.1 methyltransferase [Streptococcus pneumoniae]BAT49892.1 rRNA methyltransferase [Bacillus pumilus]AKC67084.1 rRNA methyltransferase [Bacillus altitudinis]
MILKRMLPFSKELLERACQKGDIVIDATMGNGHDTRYLADLVGKDGQVFAFDVQKEAIEQTSKRLGEHYPYVHLIHDGHEQLAEHLPAEAYGHISGAVFNLGYLPGGDKTVTTQAHTTIEAINQLMDWLKPGGLIVLVIYHGHPEGKKEKDILLDYCKTLHHEEVQVISYQYMNIQNDPPFVVAIEKKLKSS